MINVLGRDVKDLRSRCRMHVFSFFEYLNQLLVTGQACRNAQFYLRVVDRNNDKSFWCNEALANTAAELGLDRNILEIRVFARHATGRRACLQEFGVETTLL